MSQLKKYDKESIVFFESRYNDIFTTSKDIADGAGISHRELKRAIRKYKAKLEKFGLKMVCAYQHTLKGQKESFYNLNEPQSTFLITLLKNTDTVLDFKMELVKQFYTMKEVLREKKTKDWEFQRLANKTTRKLETDQIKVFVDYAKNHGSQNAERYYTSFSKLANKFAQIHNRDFSDFKKLKNLEMIENVINKEIIKQIAKNIEYHQAYENIKNKVAIVAEYF